MAMRPSGSSRSKVPVLLICLIIMVYLGYNIGFLVVRNYRWTRALSVITSEMYRTLQLQPISIQRGYNLDLFAKLFTEIDTDFRHGNCAKSIPEIDWKEQISVIIVFRNEPQMLLLSTIESFVCIFFERKSIICYFCSRKCWIFLKIIST